MGEKGFQAQLENTYFTFLQMGSNSLFQGAAQVFQGGLLLNPMVTFSNFDFPGWRVGEGLPPSWIRP